MTPRPWCLAFLAIALSANAGTSPVPRHFMIRLDAASSHVWRGLELNDEVVFQPTLEYRQKGWRLAAFASFDADSDQSKAFEDFERAEYSVEYGHRFGKVIVRGGTVYYDHFDQDIEDTAEVFAAAKVLTKCEVETQVTYDFDEVEGFRVETTIGHEFTPGEKTSVDVRGTAGWNDRDMNWAYLATYEAAAADLGARVGIERRFGGMFSVHGSMGYSVLMDEDLRDAVADEDDHLVASAGCAFRF